MEEEKGGFDLLDEAFPISGQLVARPYDKKASGDDKIRALHEAEIFIAGQIAQQWSGWVEIEAEDENDFSPEFETLVLGWNLHPAFNVQFLYGPFFWADPYGFLGNHFRLTRGSVQVIDQSFGGADAGANLRSNRQVINVYGRPIEQVFYNFGFSGPSGDAEGVEPRNWHGRIAVEPYRGTVNEATTVDTMIGIFGVAGECDKESSSCAATSDRDFRRWGVDGQVDLGNARVQAGCVFAKDETGSDEENTACSVQGFYTFKDGKRPWIVPLVRWDTYEQADGDDQFDEITLTLNYYLEENVKLLFEFWRRFDAPDRLQGSSGKDNRMTVQAHVAF